MTFQYRRKVSTWTLLTAVRRASERDAALGPLSAVSAHLPLGSVYKCIVYTM